jgi:hypothetical protein
MRSMCRPIFAMTRSCSLPVKPRGKIESRNIAMQVIIEWPKFNLTHW